MNNRQVVIVSTSLSDTRDRLSPDETESAQIRYMGASREVIDRAVKLCQTTVMTNECLAIAYNDGEVIARVTLDITVEWMD